MGKPKRSPLEAQVGAISEQDRAKQAELNTTAQGTRGQFEGPVDQSPFYKSMLKAGTEGTASAYRSAKSNTAARAKEAGFGYEQPIAQGAQNEVGAREADAQSRVPGEALLGAAPLSLEAASGTAGTAATLGGQGVAYSGQQVGLETQYQQALAARQRAMWNALARAEQTAASAGT